MGFLDYVGKKIPGLSVDEALIALSKGSVMIDVRTEAEYVAAHAPMARLVDPEDLAQDASWAIWGDDPLAERDAPIVVICDTGLRSHFVAARLRKDGYLAECVRGGLVAWTKAGHPVIPGPDRHSN